MIHFFKIIHDDAIRDGKLGIPKKFVIKYGSGLSSPVILKVPCGAIWKVELLKCDGEVWLEKGWKEFAKYYSLEYGHLLVFKYKGQCNFQVIILNKSAVEIEYPSDITCAAKSNPEGKSQEAKVEANKDKISDEILDDQPLYGKTREKSFLSPQSCKKMRINSETLNISLSHTLPADTSPNGMLEPLIPDKDVGGQITQPSCSNSSSALEAANNFTSKYPFFRAVLSSHPSCGVPTSFSSSHIQGHRVKMILQVSDRMWDVEYVKYLPGKQGRISSGWTAFKRENFLGHGDVCIFELVEKNKLNVSIFRCIK